MGHEFSGVCDIINGGKSNPRQDSETPPNTPPHFGGGCRGAAHCTPQAGRVYATVSNGLRLWLVCAAPVTGTCTQWGDPACAHAAVPMRLPLTAMVAVVWGEGTQTTQLEMVCEGQTCTSCPSQQVRRAHAPLWSLLQCAGMPVAPLFTPVDLVLKVSGTLPVWGSVPRGRRNSRMWGSGLWIA